MLTDPTLNVTTEIRNLKIKSIPSSQLLRITNGRFKFRTGSIRTLNSRTMASLLFLLDRDMLILLRWRILNLSYFEFGTRNFNLVDIVLLISINLCFFLHAEKKENVFVIWISNITLVYPYKIIINLILVTMSASGLW